MRIRPVEAEGIPFGLTDRHVTKLIRSHSSQFCTQTAKYMNRYTRTCRLGILEKSAEDNRALDVVCSTGT